MILGAIIGGLVVGAFGLILFVWYAVNSKLDAAVQALADEISTTNEVVNGMRKKSGFTE